MYQKKTKIVATIGPATSDEKILTGLVKAGLDVVRINFSHGDFVEHQPKVDRARSIAKKLGKPVAILQDLGGPKIRIGEFYQERVTLKAGTTFTLTTKKVVGDETKAFINYPKLPKEVKKGGIIFLDDGKKKLEVLETTADSVKCKILVGGECKGRRGVNVPGAYLSISSLTEKDRADLEFGFKNDVDFVALSFVRRAEDIKELRQILDKRNKSIKIIAKIETQEAVDNLDAIIAETDGVMVARGDLAIEVPAEEVPIIQKLIIQKCNLLGKPVITATQMLESMISSPVPTRAEVNDVANAIFDGTSAVMLSEETTLGKYPLEAVSMMTRIAKRTEEEIEHHEILQDSHLSSKSVTDAISLSALNVAHEIGAEAIVALSNSGMTARMVARHRPHKPLIVLTPDQKVYQQLALSFGCFPVCLTSPIDSVVKAVESSKKTLLAKKLVKKGDKIVITAGAPFGRSSSTNLLLVQTV
ncbi:MAG: pyruvate kinase [Candidatus Pacebacteria bacterium]|nr:pyruvate kinase [Candidatus Paceibacterota bacterium]